MGVTVTSAARIFKGQKKGHSGEEEILTWETFPNVAMVKVSTLKFSFKEYNAVKL